MSQSLEDLLDLTLDTRRQRRLQHEAEQAGIRMAIDEAHAKLEHEQRQFATEVHSLIQAVIERANRHLAKRPEHCGFSEVSGYFTGPRYAGASACNPIAYELRSDGRKLGDTLLVEITHDGMIEASLVPHPPVPDVPVIREDLGWRPVPLREFNAATACELMIWFLTTIVTRFSLDREP